MMSQISEECEVPKYKTWGIELRSSVCQEGLNNCCNAMVWECVYVCVKGLEPLNMSHGFMRLSVCIWQASETMNLAELYIFLIAPILVRE